MAGDMAYFRCPYCVQNIRTNHNGKYIVKTTARNSLILKCMKCSGIFRISYVGVPLLWSDMTLLERRCFTVKEWTKEKMKNANG